MTSTATAPVFETPPPPATTPVVGGGIRDFAEECLTRTAEALHESRAATAAEIQQGIAAAREFHANGTPMDLIEQIARIQGHAEEHLGPAILELGSKVSATFAHQVPMVPFAGKLIAPSAFYESFDQMHKLARLLLAPVIYAEDTDAIGTASINPVAATILAEEIQAAVFKRFGIRPFLTVARLDYESWSFLTRKHFEL
jgi:hypothetical protein